MVWRSYCRRLFAGLKPRCGLATHRLEIDLNLDPQDDVGVVMTVTIQGEPDVGIRDQYILVDWLEDAVSESADYPIFSCSCGVPGCSGFDSVTVEVGPNTIRWAWTEYRHCHIAVFDREELQSTIEDAVDDFAALMLAYDGAKWDGRS